MASESDLLIASIAMSIINLLLLCKLIHSQCKSKPVQTKSAPSKNHEINYGFTEDGQPLFPCEAGDFHKMHPKQHETHDIYDSIPDSHIGSLRERPRLPEPFPTPRRKILEGDYQEATDVLPPAEGNQSYPQEGQYQLPFDALPPAQSKGEYQSPFDALPPAVGNQNVANTEHNEDTEPVYAVPNKSKENKRPGQSPQQPTSNSSIIVGETDDAGKAPELPKRKYRLKEALEPSPSVQDKPAQASIHDSAQDSQATRNNRVQNNSSETTDGDYEEINFPPNYPPPTQSPPNPRAHGDKLRINGHSRPLPPVHIKRDGTKTLSY